MIAMTIDEVANVGQCPDGKVKQGNFNRLTIANRIWAEVCVRESKSWRTSASKSEKEKILAEIMKQNGNGMVLSIVLASIMFLNRFIPHLRRKFAMNKLIFALAATIFYASAAFAQGAGSASADKAAAPTASAASSCEAKAVGKNGKPLAGAAKAAFMKKCESGAQDGKASASCEAKAVGKNGKPLAGAAKSAFMKKCEAGGGK